MRFTVLGNNYGQPPIYGHQKPVTVHWVILIIVSKEIKSGKNRTDTGDYLHSLC